MGRPSDPAHLQRQIDTAREELTAVLAAEPRLGPRVARALAALQALERALIPEGFPASRRRGPKPAESVEDYGVEDNGQGEVLAEYRSTGAEPFRCPKQVLVKTAAELQKHKLVKFVDLHKAIRKAMDERVADYHVRTALRFMKYVGLVRHERARYSPAIKGSLRKAVLAEWKKLQAET